MPVLDVVHHYHGFHMPGGGCRIRVYRPAGFPPVVIASELPENTNTSITNIVDELAPAVLAAYLPDRVGQERPFIWIEHYPATYDLVTFPDYTPRRELQAGRWRVLFGEPEWRRLTRAQVEAMVGQTMTSKGREYRYYGCRHIYDRRTGHDCSARYVRAEQLETGIWAEVRRVLANPALVLKELSRESQTETDPAEVAEVELLEQRVASLTKRERRLVNLYSFGEVDEAIVRDGIAEVRREKSALDGRLRTLHPSPAPRSGPIDKRLLDRACQEVDRWLDQAGEADRQLALEALQVAVTATREQATLSGVLPLDASEFFILQRASA